MEETQVETSVYYVQVLERLDSIDTNVQNVNSGIDMVFAMLMVLCGVVVGVAVGFLFHDLWRT